MEAWCNLEGQYLSIISDLNDVMAEYGQYEMSMCSVGIMGTSYVRDESLPEKIELTHGDTMIIDVPHIYGEYTIGTEHSINLRQSSSSPELDFIEITEFDGHSSV